MKRRGKRLLSLLMAMVMTLMLIPTTAWASFGDLLTRDTAYNAEILAALKQVAGSEDAAKQYYEILRQYNLLDEDGNTVDSWSIAMDGEDITLDQLRELLAGDYDPDAYVWVDGTPVTLENINLILQIEDYISYLRETYFSDIQWTDEQRENLNSLMNQLSTDGIQLYAGTDAVGESGYSHAAMVTVVQDTNQSTDAQGVFSVTLADAAEGQEVSFQWEAQAGTQELDTSGTLSGTIELTAGADGTASTTFTVPLTTDQQDGLLSTQARQYFIQLTGLKGALFNDGNNNALYTAATVIATGSGATISGSDALFQQDSPNVNQTGTTVNPAPEGGVWADPDTDERHYAEWSADIPLTEDLKQSLMWGVLDAVRLESAYHEDHYNNESGWLLPGGLVPVEKADQCGFESYMLNQEGEQVTGPVYTNGAAIRYYHGSIALAGGSSTSVETGFPNIKAAYEWEDSSGVDNNQDRGNGLRVVDYAYDYYLGELLEEPAGQTVLDLLPSDIAALTADGTDAAQLSGDAYYLETRDANGEYWTDVSYDSAESQWGMQLEWDRYDPDFEEELLFRIQQYADQSYVYFVNNTPPEIESIEIPEGTYALGQQVPIIVTFSEPVCTMYNSLQVNGDHYVAAQYDNEGGYSNVLVFAYGVQQGDAILGLENLHVNAANISDDPTFEEADLDYSLDGVTVTNQPETAISGFSVSSAYSDSDPYLSYAQVSLFQDGSVLPIEALSWLTGSLKSDMMTTYTQQELEEMEQENPGSTSKLTSVYISLDGGETQYPLTYDSDTRMLTSPEFTPPQLSAVRELTHVVELYIGGELVMGKCVLWQIEPVALWQEGDVTATLRVTDNETYLDYDYAENGAIFPEDAAFGIDYIIDPSLIPGPTFDEETFTTYQLDPDTASGYAEDALGQKIPVDETANFVWWTSNPGVATINEFGELTATGAAGEVKIYLTALNGNRDIETQNDDGTYVTGKCRTDYPVTYTYQDPEAAGGTTTTDTLVFGVGQTPFLTVGGSQLTAAAGQDLTLIWTSNITAKNAANRGDDTSATPFTVTLYHGDEQTWTWTYESTNANTIARATIPADYLTYDYENGSNSYQVTISAPYYGSAADTEGTVYSTTIDISLESQPAQVELDDLASYYITDGGTVDIGWTIRNFDFYDSGQDLFRFSITDDSGNTVQDTPTTPGNGTGGTFTGSYRMNVPDVEATSDNPNSYRKVYTVTIQAKNGTDSTWSYDSFLLYVYDANALQILVDGAAGGNHTLSNRETFSEMDQEQILALNRDIYLKEIISINYGDYAWNEVADQIIWDVEGDAATLNYQQGALYSNIDDISYVSYRPTAEFGLSGVDDGTITLSATHKLVNFSGRLDIQVETMKDRLYLFQCYPQAVTQLTFEEYADAAKTATREVTIYSDDTGAAAYYAEYGIASDVYCQAKDESGAITGTNNNLYTGTIYCSSLASGEGDWTRSQRYPVNNLNLRRAAYAYVYLKNPDGTPYTGQINFRGGVYVDEEYRENAKFSLNTSADSNNSASQAAGNVDTPITVGSNGRLEIIMDQTQWGLEGDVVSAGNSVSYVFQIEAQGTGSSDPYPYYPLLVTIDATANIDSYVGNGEAAVNFVANPEPASRHPYIAAQATYYQGSSRLTSVLGSTGNIGPSYAYPEAHLNTVVVWWGLEDEALETVRENGALSLKTTDGVAIAADDQYHTLSNTSHPFSSIATTQYDVELSKESLTGILAGDGKGTLGLYLDYYQDGSTLSRREALPFRLGNTADVTPLQESQDLDNMLGQLGEYSVTKAEGDWIHNLTSDNFVSAALNLVGSDSYTEATDGLFGIRFAPTADPSKFLGLIYVNAGQVKQSDDDAEYGFHYEADPTLNYTPGLAEMQVLTSRKTTTEYYNDQLKEMSQSMAGQAMRDTDFTFSGYMESLIYWDFNEGTWKIQVLNGGFNAGAGVSYSWNYNTWCGPVPFTATLTIGGSAQVGMDALSVAYYNTQSGESGIGTDFLTQLRIYLYLKFFAGVGFDYSVIAFKLGIYGQISMDMQFQWLNRPYMNDQGTIKNTADGGTDGTLDGQRVRIDGEIGLEFLVKFLFVSFNKVLFSYSFNIADYTFSSWDSIQSSWEANQKANQQAIEELLRNGSLSVSSAGGRNLYSLNLAPTLESRDYLANGEQVWMYGIAATNALDSSSAMAGLSSNTYPYADPVLTEDGAIVVYLSDTGSEDVERTRVYFSTRDAGGAYAEGKAIDDAFSYGDSQLSLAGTGGFAVAAWTRQTESVGKSGGESVTNEDQMVMLNSADIYAAVYDGDRWNTTALTSNATPDLAPVAATNGRQAIVAWRAVATSGEPTGEDGAYSGVTNFDERDTILYRVYNGSAWSEPYTLYNGTSGSVKAIEAAMLSDGTAAVVYTLDTDETDSTTADREIVYAVVNSGNNSGYAANDVIRNVRATKDSYLDENPQITAVKFGADENSERFVLGWYTEQSVSTDSAQVLDGGSQAADTTQTTSDIRLITFDNTGAAGQDLPDSISQVTADSAVSITSNFRFVKGAETIDDLSILWVERDAEIDTTLFENGSSTSQPGDGTTGAGDENIDLSEIKYNERDVLKSVKFYTQDGSIRFTGALDVADMADAEQEGGTLIDHFDAYVSSAETNQLKAVILGTTYGAPTATSSNGLVTKSVLLADNETVAEVTVPTSVTNMYTATGSYADQISVSAVLADYDTIRLGANTQIQFTVKNEGIHAVDSLTIQLTDPDGTSYTTEHKFEEDSPLLPGQTISVYADYRVPESGVVDPAYTVEAAFSHDGASGTAVTQRTISMGLLSETTDLTQVTGTIYLNLPDVEITEAKVVNEEEGKRTIQIKLNNHADAALIEVENAVKLSFYSDATCETPLEVSYGGQGKVVESITITDQLDLDMMNEGGYAVQVTFDVGEFVKGEDGTTQEIPESGITVYLKAEVLGQPAEEDAAGGTARAARNTTLEAQGEPTASDNYASVTCDNLQVRTGQDVTLAQTMDSDADGNVTVDVTVQNNLLTQKASGNLIVTLLGADGSVLAQKQSYDASAVDKGLISLSGEEKRTLSFQFTDDDFAEGFTAADIVRVQVTYSDLVIDEGGDGSPSSNTNLSALTAEGVTGLTYDELTKTYTGTATELTSALLSVVAEDPGAKLTINGTQYDSYQAVQNLSLTMGTNTVTITVTAPDGQTTASYTLRINNVEPVTPGEGDGGSSGGGGSASYTVTVPSDPAHGSVLVSPSRAHRGDTVTITARPDDGYKVGTITVTTPSGGTVTVTDKGDGTYTFTMPGSRAEVNVTFVPEDAWSNPFSDVPADAWYFDAVQYVNERGLMAGTGSNTFDPDLTTTRGMIVTILYSLEGTPAVSTASGFTDVAPGAYYANAVTWAAGNGIVAGYGGGLFGPDDIITREQLAMILYRYAQYKGYDVTARAELSGYDDAGQVAAYAVEAMRWAIAEGLISGTSATALSPGGNATRSQAAVILTQFCQHIVE